MFSILIPTWNNLPYLQRCVDSIRKHAAFDHEIVLHINEGTDGTLEWAQTQGIAFTHSPGNIGICKAVNQAFLKTTRDYIVYLNDDMYVLPGWDTALYEAAQNAGTTCFMLSGTLIEPRDTGNPVVIHADFGQDLASFREEELLSSFSALPKSDWSGSTWPPVLIHRLYWGVVGGFSIEFSPGMYSDPDLTMKLWEAGCRHFQGVGASRVYHFQAKSTGRARKNNGRIQFMKKWGLPASAFYKYYIYMGKPYAGKLQEPSDGLGLTLQRLKAAVQHLLHFNSRF